MKLESLKSSKFEAFKGNVVKEILNIKGGACTITGHEVGGKWVADDTYNKDWSKGPAGTVASDRDWGTLNDPRCGVTGTVDSSEALQVDNNQLGNTPLSI